MFKIFSNSRLMVVLFALTAMLPAAARSQESPSPRLPGAPQPTTQSPVPFGAVSAETYAVSSSANEHGSYVWIVAPIQHVVVLCEKLDTAKDFTCNTKRLP